MTRKKKIRNQLLMAAGVLLGLVLVMWLLSLLG